MRFRDDRRAVSVQVGAILLFGVLVTFLSIYQATAVPEQNKQVEFDHNQRVQEDMLDVSGSIQRAVTDTNPRPVPVEMGAAYPSRVLLVNPPPPSGQLRAEEPRTVGLTNVTASNPETRDFLDGRYEVERRALSYRPGYNVYRAAPTTAIEGSVAVNRQDGANNTAISDQSLVEGRRITLVALRGEFSRAQSGSVSVDSRAVSTAVRTTEIRNTTAGNVTVTVPSTLTASRWADLLAGEESVVDVADAGSEGVNVTLAAVEPGDAPYELRVGVVGVGTGVPDPEAAYLTSPGAPSTTLSTGDRLVFSVQDRYHNPAPARLNVVSGTDLVADDDDATPTVYEPADRVGGEYRLEYTGGSGTVEARIVGSTSEAGNASVTVGSSGGSSPGAFPSNPAAYYPLDTVGDGTAEDMSGNGNDGTINGPTPTSGVGGTSAASFDGVDDDIDFGNLGAPTVDFTSPFSVSLWARPGTPFSGGNGFSIFASKYAGQSWQVVWNENEKYIYAYHTSNEAVNSGSAYNKLDRDQWYHVAVVYQPSGGSRLYVNATDVSNGVQPYSPSTNTRSLVLGRRPDQPTSNNFEGAIDEFRIYDRALSASEVQALYDSPAG